MEEREETVMRVKDVKNKKLKNNLVSTDAMLASPPQNQKVKNEKKSRKTRGLKRNQT